MLLSTLKVANIHAILVEQWHGPLYRCILNRSNLDPVIHSYLAVQHSLKGVLIPALSSHLFIGLLGC